MVGRGALQPKVEVGAAGENGPTQALLFSHGGTSELTSSKDYRLPVIHISGMDPSDLPSKCDKVYFSLKTMQEDSFPRR
jgi:hypothetical protein